LFRPEQEHKALKIANALEESHLFSQDSAKEQPFSRTTRCENKKHIYTHNKGGSVRSSTTTLEMAKIWRKAF
jgi:hypothetical protein